MNIFELIYPRFYFDKSKPIRMFEAFSGVGCQAMALKRITNNYELVGFSEIDVHAIKSYQAIHGEVKNYGDITMMGEIPPCDIFTWSFPCTDLSKAGKQKGLSGGTRSGLVYEVLRLLHATEIKPKILIMENVIDLVQVKFVEQFNEIQRELEELGYTNYNDVLNAKDFQIPQNRERVFMVSILGDEENEHYAYDFPIKRPLKIRLKDVLEENVDEKYYLSEQNLKTLTAKSTGKYQRAEAFRFNIKKTMESGVVGALPAGQRISPLDPYWAEEVKEDSFIAKKYREFYEENGYIPDFFNPYNKTEIKDVSPTITTQSGSTGTSSTVLIKEEATVLIKEATAKGYAEATDGDGVYINRPEQKRGVVQKGMIQTIKANSNDVGVVVKSQLKAQMAETLIEQGKVQEFDVIRHSYTKSRMNGEMKDIQENNMSPTLDTRADCLGVVVQQKGRGYNKGGKHEICPPITSNSFQENNHLLSNLRIRKLTPLECWRLMGIDDEDYWKAKNAGVSNSQLYKQAGNGIVVNVFEAILREMIR